jgi:DNA polymerase III epsilon subunit family exonuclease
MPWWRDKKSSIWKTLLTAYAVNKVVKHATAPSEPSADSGLFNTPSPPVNPSVASGQNNLGFITNYVLLSLKTTGPSWEKDEIIAITALKVYHNEVVDRFTSLVKPPAPINSQTTARTGITAEMVENAPTIDKVIQPFIDFVGEERLVGHNILLFDIRFICYAYHRICKGKFYNSMVDTLTFCKILAPHITSGHLEEYCHHFGVDIDGDQSLEKDAEIINALYRKLCSCRKKIESYLLQRIDGKLYQSLGQFSKVDDTLPILNKKVACVGALAKIDNDELRCLVGLYHGTLDEKINGETEVVILNKHYFNDFVMERSIPFEAIVRKLQAQGTLILSENQFYSMMRNNIYLNEWRGERKITPGGDY